MREVHESLRKTLTSNAKKLKHKVDDSMRDVQFEIRDLVMVHLNKARLQKGVPHKL